MHGRHEVGFKESGFRCQMVGVYSVSNPKIYRRVCHKTKLKRIIVDYGKGIWRPNVKVGGTMAHSYFLDIRHSRYWENLVLDGHCYRIFRLTELNSKKRALYVQSEPDASRARTCCGIFFDTLGKVLEGNNER